MTTEKNIAIAEMLGFKFYSKWIEFGRSETTKTELPNFIDIYGETIQAPQLKFHSDANWQFEALLFINRLGYEYELCSYLPIIKDIGVQLID